MRVLIVVQNLPVPFDRRVWLEATTLARNGDAVTVICPRMKGFNQPHEIIEDVEIFRYPLPIDAQGTLGFVAEFIWCFVMTSFLSFRVALWGRGFDILHVCNPPETYWPLAWFWRCFGKAFIFDHHDLSPEMYAAKTDRPSRLLIRALLWLERRTFAAAQIVITTNESHRRIAIERGGQRPEDVFIVRSGPDLARFKVMPREWRWSLGQPQLLVYLGEICKQDGVDHLVRAVKILRDELGRTDFHCVFVGGGPYQPTLKAYAEAQGIMDFATFTGRVSDEDLCRILSSATVAVDPDPKNDWSDKSTMNKIVEYMYFGLPIVSYDLHEARVSADEAAVYVEPNNERALAEGIAHLIDDPTRRQAMGAIGAARVREKLAWDYSVPKLLAAYARAASMLRRRGPVPRQAERHADP
ncbi:MAG TPA: glycosyltransferase family 4 protein [Stellaceae bacterium]|jgi:glycosyltransferase involved in cell wall biosynthesis|nr:glycosyltransferase family 4 protein [Stellaceae bacterium]